MNCHSVFNCVGHNHEITSNSLIKETVLSYVNEAEFKELFTIAALEKIETVTSSAIAATSSAIKASLEARNAVNDLSIQTMDFVNDAINNTAVEGGVLADTFVTATANGAGTVARTQRDKNSDFVTVKDFGILGDGSDESGKLDIALIYAASKGLVLDGLGMTCSANSLPVVSNMHLRNITINSNKYNTRNSIFESIYGSPSFIENISFENVHLNGMRELHTEVSVVADGGRCCIFIRRPVRNLLLKNCTLNNAVTDGIMILAIDWTHPYTFMRCQNIEFNNVTMNNNGRHGGCIDNVDGFRIIGGEYKYNGRHVNDVDPLDYTLGTSARLDTGIYGSGFDVEEYHGDSISKNVLIQDAVMTENAGIGLVFARTANITKPSSNIRVVGGQYDYGIGVKNSDKVSIDIGGYTFTGSNNAYEASVSNVDLGGGRLKALRVSDLSVYALRNCLGILMGRSHVLADREYPYIKFDAVDSSVRIANTIGGNTYLGETGKDSVAYLHNSGVQGSESKLSLYQAYGELDLGGLTFQRAGAGTELGVNMSFRMGNTERWSFNRYGDFSPVDNEVSWGSASRRLKVIHSATDLVVTSDSKYKTDVTGLDTKELNAATAIKDLIRKYKFISEVEERGAEAQWHFGVIAQEVEQVLISNGLNPAEYGFLCIDIDEEGTERYAIRYSELILFLITNL